MLDGLGKPQMNSVVFLKLAEVISDSTAYPRSVHSFDVALIKKYPRLKQPGSLYGLYGWQQRIKYNMAYRRELRVGQAVKV